MLFAETLKVSIDYNTADSITVEVLKDAYLSTKHEIETLRETKDKLDFQLRDLRDAKKQNKAFRKALKYFTTRDEYDQFIKENT